MKAVEIWARMSEVEKSEIASETAHLRQAFLLLQALDREAAVAVQVEQAWDALQPCQPSE